MEIIIKSSVGKFEAVYSHSKLLLAPVVMVVNSVGVDSVLFSDATDAVFDVFVKNNFSALKFNFRKNRTFSKDYADEEINLLDLTAAIDWLHLKNIECKSFWLVGFDLGAYFGLQLVMRRPEIDNYMLFSPNIKKNDLTFVVPCSSSGVLVRGGEDLRFTEEDSVILQDKLTTKTESKIKSFTIYDAERNYDTKLELLKEETEKYIQDKLNETTAFLHSSVYSKRRRRRRKKQDFDDEKQISLNPVKELNLDNI